MTIKIVNLTPHPVTIYRTRPSDAGAPADREPLPPVTYPACAPADLPRAVETPRADAGCMELSVSGDTQDAYENHWSMVHSGVVDFSGYSGVENLPDLPPDERAFGCTTFRIVSIVTAIGALAAGRPIVDLLIPMGQVRDGNGLIIGATGLAPASALLTPAAERIKSWFDESRRLLVERTEALRAAREQLDLARGQIADLTRVREEQQADLAGSQS